jgi:hypothetical protein
MPTVSPITPSFSIASSDDEASSLERISTQNDEVPTSPLYSLKDETASMSLLSSDDQDSPDDELKIKKVTTNPPKNHDDLKKAVHLLSHNTLRDILAERNVELKLKEQQRSTRRSTPRRNFFIFTLIIPTMISLWYATAILFPPGAKDVAPLLLWTPGSFERNDQGQPVICPREVICSEGGFQIFLVTVARLTGFATYPVMGLTFVSKMHSTILFLSSTYLSTLIPLESLHDVHKYTGKIYFYLVIVHTITHYLRYIIRGDSEPLLTSLHYSGVLGVLSMTVVVLSMSSIMKKVFPNVTFERRFNAHWMFLLLVLALCFHRKRSRIITLIFFGLWVADYLYSVIFRIYRLEVVEFVSLGSGGGTQMLWRNPKGFTPKSGEFVQIKLPWLTEGGNEWHPFSVYLKEATKEGIDHIHGSSLESSASSVASMDMEGGLVQNLLLEDFIMDVIHSDFRSDADTTSRGLFLNEEARVNKQEFSTTQVFINPDGDWSSGLAKDITKKKQLSSCWVRGPYKSPYFVAADFSHLVLTASGIGITPALGVMEQYPGFSRTKILVWSTRDAKMLKFFAPLLKDAHLAIIYYTGKEELSDGSIAKLQSYGNIWIQQSRPKSGLTGTIETAISMFESQMNDTAKTPLHAIDEIHRAAWCVLYCGGSKVLRNELHGFSKSYGLGFESELFDW